MKKTKSKKPAAKVKPTKPKVVAAKAAATKPEPPDDAEVLFPGRIEIATAQGSVVEDLPLQDPLLAETTFAVLLTAAERRAHIYTVLRTYPAHLVAVLAYAEAGKLAAGDVRLPQRGAWLSCPTDGTIFVLASPRRLSRDQIVELVDDRAPPPIKGGGDRSFELALPR